MLIIDAAAETAYHLVGYFSLGTLNLIMTIVAVGNLNALVQYRPTVFSQTGLDFLDGWQHVECCAANTFQ